MHLGCDNCGGDAKAGKWAGKTQKGILAKVMGKFLDEGGAGANSNTTPLVPPLAKVCHTHTHVWN